MSLDQQVKTVVADKIEEYEGRVNHFYLDSVGKVTVGIGNLVVNRAAVAGLVLYQQKNDGPAQLATLQQKQAEYDNILKQKTGYRSSWYRQYSSLMMEDADIDALLAQRIDSFYQELTGIYKKSKGYPDDFDKLPGKVQMALFDMIFNLGAGKIVNVMVTFNANVKAGEWAKAADSSKRAQISAERNQYVRQLFLDVAQQAPQQ